MLANTDLPEFRIIGGAFRLGDTWKACDYYGPVVASRDAFYLRIDQTPTDVHGGSIAGLLALGVTAAVGGDLAKHKEIKRVDYAKLPGEVQHHPDWPLRLEKGQFIVVPREAIKQIRTSFWGTFDLECDDRTICICLKLLDRRKTLRFLKAAGWDEQITRKNTVPAIEFAPLLGIAVGCSVGAAIGSGLGLPMVGVFSKPMLIGYGMAVGFVTGTVVMFAKCASARHK